ncbi:ROK family transcriptional regulator [Ruminococcaceae bacterium OttesenSCG-928-A16]|nr:ROK family transcriptional regulator [Ruminococcaceae bacterium OttesenSCG-928-A16]
MQGNTSQLRRINTDLLRSVLRKNPGSTKAQLAQKSGLSYPTCSTIINALTKTGEVLACPEETISGGRPSVLYQYNGNFGSLLCMAVVQNNTQTTLALTAYNLLGKVLHHQTTQYHHFMVADVKQAIAGLMPTLPPVQCICVGIPGVTPDGRTITLCDTPGLENTPLAQLLQDEFALPIYLENDTNLTVLGFARSQNLPAGAPAVALAFPQRHFPGAGILADGRLLRGFSNFAGEVSFMPFGYQRGTPQQQIPQGPQFAALLNNTVLSLICTLNPSTILLTGSQITPQMLPPIQQFCAQHLPAEHLPNFVVNSDFLPYYTQGLLALAQEKTAYPLQIVEKKL